ncbi:MAG TPA: hypothetical protein VM933_00720 [Acidimicrobiales bacterium]|nr:hypothetical protein [Acidimicrobiales bacterium]
MSRSSRQALVLLGTVLVVLVVIVLLALRSSGDMGLRVQVVSGRRTEPGSVEPYSVTVNDTKGRITAVRVDFGDGRVEDIPVDDEACGEPLVREFELEHAFEFQGFSTIAAVVETGGCGADTERVEAIRTIEVRDLRR